jgi:membrane protein
MTRAAALAFYAALSVAPILLLLVWALSLLHAGGQDQLTEAVTTLVGQKAAEALVTVIQSAQAHPRLGDIAGIVGVVLTGFSASAVFAQLQGTLNRVWRVKAKPGEAVGTWVRARARAVALLGGMAFLLIISFVVSAVIQSVMGSEGTMWTAVKYGVSIVVFAGAFCLMYKVLPNALIDWTDALVGAALTTALFLAGEFAIGLYVARSNVGSAYGPAGAFVILLTWTYYASLIVLMGAELTRGLADARGKPIRPSAHAVEIAAAPAELNGTDAVSARASPGRPRARTRQGQVAAAGIALLVSGAVAGAALTHACTRKNSSPPAGR